MKKTLSTWVEMTMNISPIKLPKVSIFLIIFLLNSLSIWAQYMHFDGVNDKIRVPKNGTGVLNNFSTPHDFTVEIRFRYHGTPTGALISKHAPPANGYFIEINGAQQVQGGMGFNGNYTKIVGSTISINTFYHAALSYNVASNSIKFYVNGALIGTQTLGGTYYPNINEFLCIGASDYWGSYAPVIVDYARVWNIQKTDADILANYNVEVACNSANLLVNYNFEEGIPLVNNTGITSINDCTSNNNEGTPLNFALTGSSSNFFSLASACTNPTAYTVTGGGAYCAGGAGVAVGLGNSETGVNYQLQLGGVNDGAAVAGTGAAISFGNKTAAGTYTVVAISAGGGCTTNMTGNAAIIVSSPTAVITPTGSTTFCAGAPTTLNASTGTGYTYQWKRGTTIVQVGGVSYIPTASGNHSVTVKDAANCSSTSAITAITINALPTANAGADKSLCKGASVQIGAATTAGYTYSWSPATGLNNPSTSNPTLAINASGTYTVFVTNGTTGCNKSDAMVLTSLLAPATPNVSKTVSGTTITLTSNTPGAVSVNWYSNGILLFGNMAPNSSINVVASNPAKAYTTKSKGTNGCLSSFSNFVSAKVGDGKTGDVLVEIDENIMQAYPNPTNGLLNLVINDAALTGGKLLLYNNLGQVVIAKEISFFAGKANATLDLQQLAAGVYSLSFENKVIKVVKE